MHRRDVASTQVATVSTAVASMSYLVLENLGFEYDYSVLHNRCIVLGSSTSNKSMTVRITEIFTMSQSENWIQTT